MSFRKSHGCIFNQILQITLEEKLGEVIKDISIDASNMNWLMDALKESHHEEKRYHESAITTLKTQYNKLQNRIDQVYTDKLDRKIPEDLF
jgi:hypothetical protein